MTEPLDVDDPVNVPDLDDWDPTETHADPEGDVDDLADAGPIYTSLDEWVRDWLAPIALRRAGKQTWCAKWWAHPEAAARLGAAWAAWEAAWDEGGSGPSHWWVYHWSDHWRELSSTSGTFGACTPTQHREVPPHLAIEPQPKEYGNE